MFLERWALFNQFCNLLDRSGKRERDMVLERSFKEICDAIGEMGRWRVTD